MGSYLRMSYDQLYATLKSQKKSDEEIDRIFDKVNEAKKKIANVVKKFRIKIEQKYDQLEESELVKKDKHRFMVLCACNLLSIGYLV